MPSHRLRLDRKGAQGEWLLAWDSERLTLTSPQGEVVSDVAIEHAHRLFQLYELDAEKRISLPTDIGSLTFKRDGPAARDVRDLITQGMRSDPEFREEQARHARRNLPIGLGAFIVGGGLFALYCWWASWAPDPPKGHWLYMIGWLIHLILLALLAMALAGPYVAYLAWKQLRRVREAERGAQSLKW